MFGDIQQLVAMSPQQETTCHVMNKDYIKAAKMLSSPGQAIGYYNYWCAPLCHRNE